MMARPSIVDHTAFLVLWTTSSGYVMLCDVCIPSLPSLRCSMCGGLQAALYDGDDAIKLADRLGDREEIVEMLRPPYFA